MHDSKSDCKTDQARTLNETVLVKNPIMMNTKTLCAVSAIAVLAAGAAMADSAQDQMKHADGANENAHRPAKTRLL